MSIITALNTRLRAAAALIETGGWVQGEPETRDGRHSATGAVLFCGPVDGDEAIITVVLHYRNRAVAWNDEPGRTAAEVIDSLRVDITDTELERVFGPQWEHALTVSRFDTNVDAETLATLMGAYESVDRDEREVAWAAARKEISDDLYAATDMMTVSNAGDGAVNALLIRHLISADGFTQEHYNTLVGPWARVVGPAHPDDQEPTR